MQQSPIDALRHDAYQMWVPLRINNLTSWAPNTVYRRILNDFYFIPMGTYLLWSCTYGQWAYEHPIIALVLYDYLLTFNEEVEFFWKRRRPANVSCYRLNLAMTVFFLSRYTPIVASVTSVATNLLTIPSSVCTFETICLWNYPFGSLTPEIEVLIVYVQKRP